jgi:hypothetical protein
VEAAPIHAYAMLKDPPAISLPPEALKKYVGRHSGGNDLVYLVEWNGRQLMGGRQGGTMKPLLVEVRDVLFIAGQPRIRKIFQRDAVGNIIGFVDRREARDLVWHRDHSRTS